ncbi:GerAB/ArcD/ProY family transporter [Cohnella cholangitidis]|uniref:GerAB/ArcD/ProY family transporter n=1 Tax=Cohnella cholangitidis TaxID=2598458 RepID=A0A7G5C5W8_9BACL|nr:endospore germination permease [Cohnella cholangitidis]QMV44602.1 GerAB/ArcD/ProY family transporter [Cohnella cholangitidis]
MKHATPSKELMLLKNQTFSLLQISMVLILSIGMMNHVLVIPLLLDASGRDSWISTIVTFVVLIPFFLIVAQISKLTNQRSYLNEIESRYGKWLSRWIACTLSVYLVLSAAITGKDLTTWTNASYLPQTPPLVIAASFIILAMFTASKGLRSVAYSAAILFPFIVLFGEFVMVANIPHKDYSLLFPVFEEGYASVGRGVSYPGTGLVEILLLLFVQHRISTPIQKRHILLIAFLLSGLTLGPLIGGIAEFGPEESALQRYPAFEEWRLVKIGDFLEHLDFLSIFQWVSGAFVRLSFTFLLITEVCGTKKLVLPIASLLVFCMILFPVGDITFVDLLSRFYFPLCFYAMLSFTAVLYLLIALPNKSKRVNPS